MSICGYSRQILNYFLGTFRLACTRLATVYTGSEQRMTEWVKEGAERT